MRAQLKAVAHEASPALPVNELSVTFCRAGLALACRGQKTREIKIRGKDLKKKIIFFSLATDAEHLAALVVAKIIFSHRRHVPVGGDLCGRCVGGLWG